MRLDAAPLIALSSRHSGNSLAEELHMDRHRVTRWLRDGVPVDVADRVAVALGLHPAEVWGNEWWEASA